MKFKIKNIDNIEVVQYSGKVYDLTVEKDHSYNINGVIVHNSVCSTRIITGVGVPMITSILDCVEVADEYDIPVIADGGIKTPGDVAKALGAGASTVMLGSLLAGTLESPGVISRDGVWPNEQLYKKFRGSASLASKMDRQEGEKNVEGVSTIIPYKGKVKRIVNDICDGVRSSMSYVGVNNMNDFSSNVEFVQVTSSGIKEASPHAKK